VKLSKNIDTKVVGSGRVAGGKAVELVDGGVAARAVVDDGTHDAVHDADT
jgi:hypothetical protein